MMPIKSWQAVLLPAAISFVLAAAEIPPGTWFTTAAISLASGVTALTLMATAAMLGARWGFVESWFGGLDRVYRVHKWMGIWALGFASCHLAFKAGMDGWDTAAIVTLPSGVTRLVRQLSYVALMFIVLLALNRNIPYSMWRWWHKLSGPLFLIVILHSLSIKSPIELATPAGLWLALVSVLGIAAAAYKLLLYRFFSTHAEYKVTDISPGGSAVHMTLMPVGRPILFEPGQFGFLRMKEDGLREPHPFTIASGNRPDGQVEFLIRSLGDYTQKLIAETKIGMRADIYAPYGCFKRRMEAKREVWIGGGVGISPFVAWLKDETAGGFDKVTLFYFYTPGREFPNAQVLADMARQRGAEFVPVLEGPAFSQRFAEIARDADPTVVDVSFCGPNGLLEQIRQQMRRNDIPESNLRYEYFAFR